MKYFVYNDDLLEKIFWMNQLDIKMLQNLLKKLLFVSYHLFYNCLFESFAVWPRVKWNSEKLFLKIFPWIFIKIKFQNKFLWKISARIGCMNYACMIWKKIKFYFLYWVLKLNITRPNHNCYFFKDLNDLNDSVFGAKLGGVKFNLQ